MADKDKLASAFDHPIMFTFLIALTTAGWLALFTWAAKASGLPGPAALYQHP